MQISIFNFNQNSVRVEVQNGEPFFCLSDVAKILTIKNSRRIAAEMLKSSGIKQIEITDSLNRKQEATFINEPNLYRVIFRSNKPEAVKFQDWIFEEVIPQIRKTGGYTIPTTKKALPNGLTIEQQDEIKKLHRELVQAAPKEMQAKLAIMLWSSIKSKFGVSYKEVPSEQYAEVLSVMARVAVEQQNTTLHGEVLDKAPTPNAPTSQEYFAHLAKMAHYAGEYEKIQSMLCNNPNSDETKKFMTSMNWRSSQSGAAYLFVFKPDIHNDVKKAFDFLHHFSQAV